MTVIISGSGGITSVNGTAAAPSVTGTDTDTGIVYGTNTVTIATGGTAGLVQNSVQGVQIANTLGVGGATPSTSGAGITFPAAVSVSSNANTLDDYEEGTWTPILSTDGSGVFTQTTQNGTYTKIGNLVSFSLYIVWSAYSGSGSTQLTNWPFPPYWGASASQRQYGFPMKASSASATQGYIFKNDTNGYVSNTYLYTFTDSSIVAASTLGSTGWIAVSGQYFTNI